MTRTLRPMKAAAKATAAEGPGVRRQGPPAPGSQEIWSREASCALPASAASYQKYSKAPDDSTA